MVTHDSRVGLFSFGGGSIAPSMQFCQGVLMFGLLVSQCLAFSPACFNYNRECVSRKALMQRVTLASLGELGLARFRMKSRPFF